MFQLAAGSLMMAASAWLLQPDTGCFSLMMAVSA